MDGKMLARLGAVVFVGVAITATVIEMTRKPVEGDVGVVRPDGVVPASPSRAILRRCRDTGEAAARDPICLKAWADNRDRFLKQEAKASDDAETESTRNPDAAATMDDPIRKDAMPADEPAQAEGR